MFATKKNLRNGYIIYGHFCIKKLTFIKIYETKKKRNREKGEREWVSAN